MTCDEFKLLSARSPKTCTRAERAAGIKHLNECAMCSQMCDAADRELDDIVGSRLGDVIRASMDANHKISLARDLEDPEFLKTLKGGNGENKL